MHTVSHRTSRKSEKEKSPGTRTGEIDVTGVQKDPCSLSLPT